MRLEKRTIKLFQPKYIEKLLDYHSILKAKIIKITMQEIVLFSLNAPALDLKKAKYLAKVSSIIYTMIETWIDIAFATSIVN